MGGHLDPPRTPALVGRLPFSNAVPPQCGQFGALNRCNHLGRRAVIVAEEPELPKIMSEAEIDAQIQVSEMVEPRNQRQPTDRELTEEAVALLKTLFPRIHQRLVTLWGSGAGEDYLDGLIMDDRGNRQGFPPEVLRALLVLQRVHFQTFGTFKKIDPWDIGLTPRS